MMQNPGFSITFTLNGNFLGNMFVTGDMMFAAAVNNLYQYFPYISAYQPTFYFNNNPIKADSCKKLNELGIQNMSIIEVKPMNAGVPQNPGNIVMPQSGNNGDEFLNLNFSVEGRMINVQATKKDTFASLSKKLCNKAGVTDKVPSFILNSSMIDSNDSRTLEQMHIQNNQRIEVVFTQNVVGAYN